MKITLDFGGGLNTVFSSIAGSSGRHLGFGFGGAAPSFGGGLVGCGACGTPPGILNIWYGTDGGAFTTRPPSAFPSIGFVEFTTDGGGGGAVLALPSNSLVELATE